MSGNQISLAVTTYREFLPGKNPKKLQSTLTYAEGEPVISEIVVRDDGSDDFDKLAELVAPFSKVRLHRNAHNMGILVNKIRSVLDCQNERVIMFDSDNVLGRDYVRHHTSWKQGNVIYCAQFARPAFDFSSFVSHPVTAASLAAALRFPQAACFLNTANFVVPRKMFEQVFGQWKDVENWPLLVPDYFSWPGRETDAAYRSAVQAVDSAFLVSRWLLAGGVLETVPAMAYDHCVENPHSIYRKGSRRKVLLPSLYFLEVLDVQNKTPASYSVKKCDDFSATVLRNVEGKSTQLQFASGSLVSLVQAWEKVV